jgi:hypothetical protein
VFAMGVALIFLNSLKTAMDVNNAWWVTPVALTSLWICENDTSSFCIW